MIARHDEAGIERRREKREVRVEWERRERRAIEHEVG